MDRLKGIAAKSGWHPDESHKGIRNQVGAVLGRRGTDNNRPAHDATPLSQLRDPSSFAPPPRRVDGGVLPPPALPSSSSHPTTSPLNQGQYGQHYAQQDQGVMEEPPPAPRPYQVDTTGLSTANLPPPPRRRDGADGSPIVTPPPPYTPSADSKRPPPSLPPRLPPRTTNMTPPSGSPRLPTPEVPSRQTGFLDQGAVNRLGAAGVSVQGLGIGSGTAHKPASPSGVNELQSRFSKFGVGSGSGSGPTPSPPPSQGTTWAQKQAALKTMSSFKKDPSSVSLADARKAASTANNFRQRHGEQVAAGVKTANGLDQKYGVSGKVGGYLGSGHGNGQNGAASAGGPQSHLNTIGAAAGMLGKKKPPPPPPPKRKPDLGGDAARDEDTPPPVPMATRPSF